MLKEISVDGRHITGELPPATSPSCSPSLRDSPSGTGCQGQSHGRHGPRGGEAVTSSRRNLAEFSGIILEVSANEFLITVLHRLSFRSYLISSNSLTLGPFGNLLAKFNLLL
jgi:hypothetical protein